MPPPPIVLTSAVASDPVSYDNSTFGVYTLEIAPGERVRCETTASSGDVDLYLRLDAEPSLDPEGPKDCFSLASGANEVCVVDNLLEAKLLWVIVYAVTAVRFCRSSRTASL